MGCAVNILNPSARKLSEKMKGLMRVLLFSNYYEVNNKTLKWV